MDIILFFKENWSWLAVGLQLLIFAITAKLAQKFPTRTEHEELEERVDAHAVYISENRLEVQQMQATLREAPTQKSIHELALQMSELKGELKVFSEKFENVGEMSDRLQLQVDRIDQFLLKVSPRV